MGRYDLQTSAAIEPVSQGDLAFTGLNMKAPREQLGPGICARLENKRLIHGAETRPGTRTPLYANLFAANSFIGSGVYSNPNKEELGLLATTNAGVVAIRSGTAPLNIETEVNLLGPGVEFAQHFDKVLLHQSDPTSGTLIWDGVNPDVGFVRITSPSFFEPGIVVIPNPPWSVNYMGRAWFPIPDEPDSIGASDINDPSIYDRDLHEFRVNTGSADHVTTIFPYLQNNLIIGKNRSINIMTNIPDDLGDAYINSILLGLSPGGPPPARISNISTQVGIVARKGCLLIGGRFVFVSDSGAGGIFQVITDLTGNYLVDPTPISDPIEPLISRINWTYASGIVAKLDGIYAYWAVPMDGCIYNNAVLVYNVVTGQWQGVDFWNAEPRNIGRGRVLTTDNPMRIDNMLLINHYGSSHLFGVNHGNALVHRLYHGTDDQLDTAQGSDHIEQKTYKIQDVMETRGYAISGSAFDSNNVKIGLATLEPSLTFEEIIDGSSGDENILGVDPLTRSRVKYENGQPDYVLTNSNEDAEAGGREDYAVQVGDEVLLGESGIRMQRPWPWTKEFSLNTGARFASIRVANNGGIAQVRSVVFEGVKSRTERTAY